MRGLALKTRGFRHGRPCAGHPRRDVHRKFKSLEPTGAERRVEVLIPTCRLTAWMPGTRPGMTLKASCEPLILAPMGTSPGMTKAGRAKIKSPNLPCRPARLPHLVELAAVAQRVHRLPEALVK